MMKVKNTVEQKANMERDNSLVVRLPPQKPDPSIISTSTAQSTIVKDAKALVPGRMTLFDLPGELRNEIYSLALDLDEEHTVFDRDRKGTWNINFRLLQTCSQVFSEARSLMANITSAYIPVIQFQDWTWDPTPTHDLGYQVPPKVKATSIHALAEFTNVHFHVHINRKMCDSGAVLESLRQSLEIFIAHSASVSAKNSHKKRHAVVHLGDFLPFWSDRRYQIGDYERLIGIMAKDVNTYWDIRFYAPKGYKWLELDLAHLNGCCKRHNDVRFTEMSATAELHEGWEGDVPNGATMTRTPCSELWSPITPNDE